MKKLYYLVMFCLIAGAAHLSAQEVQVINLEVAADNTITFDVSWGATTGPPPDGRDATKPWSDTVWVFIDYFNMDEQAMWRLPVASAMLTNTSANWAGSQVRTITGTNNSGFYIYGLARTKDTGTVSVSVTPAGDYPRGVIRPCVYVTDYQPVATYNMASDGAITAQLAGTAPFSGQYSDGSPWISSTGADIDVPAGQHIPAFADATGNSGIIRCDASALPTVTTPTSASRCGAGAVTISATPSADATIDWYSTSTGGSPLQSGSNTYTPSVDNSSTYYAQARNIATGCVSSSRTAVTATVNPIPAVPVLENTGNQCEGTGVTFNATGGTNYEWTGAFDGQTGNTKTSPTVPGAYTTSVRNYVSANGITCYSPFTSDIIAYVNVRPTVTTSTSASRCGAGTVTITATPSSGATIDWYSASTGGSLLQSGSTAYTTPSISNTTVYYAQARNTTTGCISSSRTAVTATVNALPTITAQPTEQTICEGTNATLSVTANGSKYEWFKDGAATGTNNSSLTTGAAGNYYVKITNSNGCSVNSNTVAVTMNDKPATPALATTGNQCEGTGITFNTTGGTAYEWTGSVSGTGASKTTATTAGNYSAQVRNYVSANGITCYSDWSSAVSATVHEKPSKPTLTAVKNLICEGESTTISLPNWYGLPTDIIGQNYHISSVVWGQSANVGAGVYQGQVMHPNGCWSDFSDPLTINVVANPVITTQPTAQTVCQGTNATLSVTANGSKYEWFKDGAATGTNSNPLTTGDTGDYYVKVTDSNGCTVQSTTAKVTIHPAFTPGVIASTGQTVCQGATANQISSTTPASGGDQTITYQWLKDNSAISSTRRPIPRPQRLSASTAIPARRMTAPVIHHGLLQQTPIN